MINFQKKASLFFFSGLILLYGLRLTAQQLIRPPITGIAFVQLQVSDIKKSSVFYHSLLGYDLVPAGTTVNNKDHLFNIRVNQRQSVLLQDGLPQGQDERLLSLAFQTPDAEAFRLYLQSKGVTVPAALTKDEGMFSFAVTDPDRHTIKFVQYNTNARAQLQNAAAISKRILHAGLTIVNSKAADAFYTDILGFSEIWRGGSTDTITSWINMRVPEGTDYIEYMLVNGPPTKQQLGGMHHIALMVPDIQQALDTLNNRAAITHYEVAAPRIGRNRRWQLNLFDPDGTRIELMEPFPMR